MRLGKQWTIIPVILFCSFMGSTVQAGTATLPNTFVAGETAVAADVNENFNTLATEINDNFDQITTNADSIRDNSDAITDNSNAIDAANDRMGVRMTRLDNGATQGEIFPSDYLTWYTVCDLGDMEKDMDDSIIDLCYQSHAMLTSDGAWQYAIFRINLIDEDAHVTYTSPDMILARDIDDFGIRFQTLSLNAVYSDVPAGTYAVYLLCRSTYATVYVNPGNFSSTCVIKELPTASE